MTEVGTHSGYQTINEARELLCYNFEKTDYKGHIFAPVSILEGGRQNLRQLNCSFTTNSSQFIGIYIYIFEKTEVQTVILRC